MNRDAFLTRAQASLVTRVSADVIGKWHARGWVDREGKRRHLTVRKRGARNLEYRLGDILDAERDTRMKLNSRRGRGRALAQTCVAPAAPSGGDAPELVGDRARHPASGVECA